MLIQLCVFYRELKDECPKSTCCGKPPIIVTTLLVEGATGLELPPESKVKSNFLYILF